MFNRQVGVCMSDRLACPTHLPPLPLLPPTPRPQLRGRNMESVTSMFDPRSHKIRLVFTALTASALTATAITSYNNYSRSKRQNEPNRDVLNSLATSSPSECGNSGGGRKRKGTSPRPEQIYLNPGGRSTGAGSGMGMGVLSRMMKT